MLNRFKQSLQIFFTPNRLSISICMVLSAAGWFMTKMSKEYNHQASFIVDYNLPAKLAFSNDAPTIIEAEFRAKGWSFLRLALSQKDDTLRLGEARIFDREISTRLLLSESLNELLGDGELVIVNAAPDKISFKLVERLSKKVPIQLNGEISLKAQYQLKSALKFDPDSVTIFGAQDQLQRHDFWLTQVFSILALDHDLEVMVPLVNANPVISSDIDETKLLLQVDQVTEKEIYVPIKLPDSLTEQVKIFPNEILIKINLGLSNYEKVTANDFEVTLKQSSGLESTREVLVTKIPPEATYISHAPNNVDFYRSNSSLPK